MNAHLERTMSAMSAAGIDVLLLGRDANARFVSNADRLSVSGSRPFAPACVVVREPAAVHLLSITDDGIPSDIPPAHLFGISWNPVNLLGALAAIPGVAGPRTIGVDGLTPLFEQLVAGFLPDATVVDGETLLRNVRRLKSADDVAAIRAALTTAEAALGAVIDALVPGVREAELKGVFEECAAGLGCTFPAFEGTFCVAEPGSRPRPFVADRQIAAGDLVHVRAGVLRNGWEGQVARTLACGGNAPADDGSLAATIAAALPGMTVGGLRDTNTTVDGTGLGHEELTESDVLEPGMVLWVEHWADPLLAGTTMLITEHGSESLTP